MRVCAAGAASRAAQARSSTLLSTCACFAPKPASPPCRCCTRHRLAGGWRAPRFGLAPVLRPQAACPEPPAPPRRLPRHAGSSSVGRSYDKALITFAQPLIDLRCLMRGNAKINPLVWIAQLRIDARVACGLVDSRRPTRMMPAGLDRPVTITIGRARTRRSAMHRPDRFSHPVRSSRRRFLSGALAVAAALPPLGRLALGAGRPGQRLQLGHLHRRDHARGLHRRDRHRGPLRPVRQQRRAVRQAARGQSGLRRDLPVQRLRRAHDRRRHAAAARPREDSEHRQHRPGLRRSRRSIPACSTACRISGARSGLGYRVSAASPKAFADLFEGDAYAGRDRAAQLDRHHPGDAQVSRPLAQHQGSRRDRRRPPRR